MELEYFPILVSQGVFCTSQGKRLPKSSKTQTETYLGRWRYSVLPLCLAGDLSLCGLRIQSGLDLLWDDSREAVRVSTWFVTLGGEV